MRNLATPSPQPGLLRGELLFLSPRRLVPFDPAVAALPILPNPVVVVHWSSELSWVATRSYMNTLRHENPGLPVVLATPSAGENLSHILCRAGAIQGLTVIPNMFTGTIDDVRFRLGSPLTLGSDVASWCSATGLVNSSRALRCIGHIIDLSPVARVSTLASSMGLSARTLRQVFCHTPVQPRNLVALGRRLRRALALQVPHALRAWGSQPQAESTRMLPREIRLGFGVTVAEASKFVGIEPLLSRWRDLHL